MKKTTLMTILTLVILFLAFKSKAQETNVLLNVRAISILSGGSEGITNILCEYPYQAEAEAALNRPWKVRLQAKITTELVTNWTTASITTAVIPQRELYFAIYRSNTLNQSGEVRSNVVVEIEWRGKPVKVVVESVPIASAERHIQEPLFQELDQK